MKYIQIKNAGVAPVESFTLLGASTKRDDDSKIGMFGSGTKYAIAYCLRNRVGLRIVLGDREVAITTEPVALKGMEFSMIKFNGISTSLTVDMGPDWEAWHVVREFLCNAIDEGGESIRIVDQIEDAPDCTSVYIEHTDAMREVIERFDEYFVRSRNDQLFKSQSGAIYKKSNDKPRIYRRGVYCGNGLYGFPGYDFDLPNVAINESRMLRAGAGLSDAWSLVFECDDASVIRKVLSSPPPYTPFFRCDNVSAAWGNALKSKVVLRDKSETALLSAAESRKAIVLNDDFIDILKRHDIPFTRPRFSTENSIYKKVPMNNIERRKLEQAKKLLQRNGMKVGKVIVGEFITEGIHGMAVQEKKLIVLARSAFNNGSSFLASTLLEEYLHLETGANDYTRAFQDAIFNLAVSLMELNEG